MDQGASSFSLRNYNLYHETDPAQPFTGSENGVGGWDTFLSEWDSWRAASGFETNSPTPQLPQFVAPEAGDLHLAAGSPAIDRGVRIPGINDVFSGTAPDLGALEYGSTPAQPTITIHDAQVGEGTGGTQSLILSVTLSATSAQPVTVNVTTD